jgi:hypothetical protein
MRCCWRRRAVVAVLVGTAAALLAVAATAQAEVKEGQPAPNVELPAAQIGTALPEKKDAKTLSLADFKGKKNVVVYFFPKALTKG